LSQQIRHLEQELGVELFQRKTKRQVQLTEAGRVFLAESYLALAQIENAIRAAQRAARGETGQLVVGFVSSATYHALPWLLRNFRERFPQVEIVLRELNTQKQVQALNEQRISVGFVHPPIDDDGLTLECIQQESLVVALAETHPLATQLQISIQDLADEPFVLFPRHLGAGLYDRIVSFCQQANFSPKVTQEANQMQTIISLISAGMGVTLVPASLQNLMRTGIVYRTLQEPTPKVETAVVWRRDDTSPVVHGFLNVIRHR
jgi:DNA-binding transcriptional LysR family regulator